MLNRNQDLANEQYKIAKNLFDNKKFELALSNYNIVIDYDPDHAQAYYDRGVAKLMLDEYSDAIKDFTKYIEYRKDSKGYCKRGACHGKLDENESAINDYTIAIELASDSGSVLTSYNNRAVAYLNLQRCEEGLADAIETIKIDPKQSSHFNNRGYGYFKLNQFELALEDFNTAIKLNPAHGRPYHHRGVLYYTQLKQYNLAIADMIKAVVLNKVRQDTFANLEMLLIDAERSENMCGVTTSSLFLMLEVIEKFPEENQQFIIELLNNLYQRLEKNDLNIFGNKSTDLEDELRKNLVIKNKYTGMKICSDLYCKRGMAYRDEQQYNCAIKDLTRAILLNVNHTQSYVERSSAYHLLALYDSAIADASMAIELNGKTAVAFAIRGSALVEKKNYQEALADYNKAIQCREDDTIYYNNRGFIYIQLKEYDKAIADLTKSIQLQEVVEISWKILKKLLNDASGDDSFGISIKSVESIFNIVSKLPLQDQYECLNNLKKLCQKIHDQKDHYGLFKSSAVVLKMKIEKAIVELGESHLMDDVQFVKDCYAGFEYSDEDEIDAADHQSFYSL